MAGLYVTSLAPGAGKTAVAAALVSILRSQGRSATYWKPLALTAPGGETGGKDPDAAFCNAALSQEADLPLAVPAEALARGIGEAAPSVRERLARLSSGGPVVMEGLPATGRTLAASVELGRLADARVIAVLRYSRGLDLEAVKALREAFGDRLQGVVLNAVPSMSGRAAREEVAPALKGAGIAPLAVVPEDRLLLGFTVEEYAERLGGRVLNHQDRAHEIVESVLVGALSLDPGEYYYSRRGNKALVTRGDRPDLQFSALDTSTRCLILTQGVDPIPYVLDKAKEAGVPVVVVPGATLDTIARLEAFTSTPAFHHPRKLARYVELLQDALDPALLGV